MERRHPAFATLDDLFDNAERITHARTGIQLMAKNESDPGRKTKLRNISMKLGDLRADLEKIYGVTNQESF